MSNPSGSRFAALAAGLLGFSGVALGALGAHRLEPMLTERGMMRAWETGARYHMLHALALVGLAALARVAIEAAGPLRWAARLWVLGVLLFSGSLYWYALGGPRSLVYVTPVGGLVLLAGWVCVVAAALRRPNG